MAQILLLIRGLPGSGKSTLAKSLEPLFAHIEADQYFMHHGVYSFNAEELPKAHKYCIDATADLLDSNANVVVSNTFSRQWEMDAYRQLAADRPTVQLHIVTVYGCWQNTHNVPDAVIIRMRERWEP